MTGKKWLGSGLIALVALAMSLVSYSLVSAQASTVSVGSASLDTGKQASVDVQASGIPAPGLGGWTVDITYDPAMVTVAGCSSAGGLCNPEVAPNMVRVAGFDANGLVGDTTLATIEIQCTGAGSSSLNLTVVDLLDATPGAPAQIVAGVQNGSVACTTPAPQTSTSSESTSSTEGALAATRAPAEGQEAATLPTAGGLPRAANDSTFTWTYLLMGAGALSLLAGSVLARKARRQE